MVNDGVLIYYTKEAALFVETRNTTEKRRRR